MKKLFGLCLFVGIFFFLFFVKINIFAQATYDYVTCNNQAGICIDNISGSCYSLKNHLYPVQQQSCPGGYYLYQDPNGDICNGTYSIPPTQGGCGAQSCGGICAFHGTCCMPYPTPNPTYDCGNGTAIPSYCHTGPQCGSGYEYTQLYSCDPSLYDGCCAQCFAAQSCGTAYTTVPYSVPDGSCGWTTCNPYCTTGINTSSCTACTGGTEPTNTCGTTTGTQDCTHDTNPNGTCIQNNNSHFYNNCPRTYVNCSTNYTCTNGNICTTNIYVNVYTDYNHNGVKDGSDAGKQGVYVSDGGGNNFPTNSSGQVTFSQKATSNYTISMTTPTNFAPIGGTSHTVSLTNNAGNQTTNFYVTPLYQISGNVFTDTNKNGKYDSASETGYGGGIITVTGGPTAVSNITVAGNGTWATPNNLESGTYTVTYTTALPTDYSFTTNSAWSVTVGDPAGSPTCNKSTSPDATCGGQNNGSISNLNVGVTNENSHYQTACLDMRVDNNGGGTVTDQFPGSGATCGGTNGSYANITDASCSTGSGIVYSCNGTFDFGLGSANANNWQAGGSTSECFTPPGINDIRTSYNFLLATAQQSGITPTNLDNIVNTNPNTSCDITNCTLPANLPKGIYQVNGNLTLNTYTFPAPADPTSQYQAYIFLINGNLTINGNILIPKGSTALFSAAGNIEVAASVGQDATNPNDPAINNPNMEGIYSADQSFIIDTNAVGSNVCNANGSPLDKKLNIIGVVIDNAAQKGGQFINNRDLCTSDLQCPSITAGDDGNGDALSYLMTLIADGQFVLHKNFNWQEMKP